MIKNKKVFLNQDVGPQKEIIQLFNYEIKNEKVKKNVTKLTIEIDDNTPRHHEKYALYKKVSKWNTLPLFPVFIFTGLAIALITALLIAFILNKDNGTGLYYLIGLGTPSCIFLLATVIYTYFKFRNDLHNINTTYNLFEIKSLVESFDKGGNIDA